MNCKVPEGEKNAFFSFLKSGKAIATTSCKWKMLTHLEEKVHLPTFPDGQ